MLACLVDEMTVGKVGNSDSKDILGSFFETHISYGRKGQYFTPEPICTFMAQITCGERNDEFTSPQSIIDPACGSGRMLLASSRILGPMNYYYGIDIEATCVKICIINLFLNGVFRAEVMQANALFPDDFVVSYITSFVPLGIFRITEKEKSPLWNNVQISLQKDKKEAVFTSLPIKDGTQLSFF